MLSDEDDINDRLATAVQTASSSAPNFSDDLSTNSGARGVHGADNSPATKPAKVAFSPFEQASSSNEAHASG